MWMVVMFDLPVVEKAERKAATEFRNSVAGHGFQHEPVQRVHAVLHQRAQVETYCKRVEEACPQAVGSTSAVHRQTVRTHHQLPGQSAAACEKNA
jgi:CRISPR/Cas system-associated protein endoribonuclease Cas2